MNRDCIRVAKRAYTHGCRKRPNDSIGENAIIDTMNPRDNTRGSTTRIPVRTTSSATPPPKLTPSDPYAVVYQELERGQFDEGLWCRCLAQHPGKSEKAQSAYIELRVKQLARPAERPGKSRTEITGVKGWLHLYCVCLRWICPLRVLGTFSQIHIQSQLYRGVNTGPQWVMLLLEAPLAAFGYFVGGKLKNADPEGIALNQWYLKSFAMVTALETCGLLIYGLLSEAAVSVILSLSWVLAWWLYFRRSARVQNTFGYYH